ncbi:hypothetical protein [Halopelagius longus]|uniref:Uncharacterized protein n=1 Tax=Halopelagius longus TaxID=1236180 RepID=A0A1H1C7I4_9EURY|nr:hypothetical protein [Halopelagius longus]SDQ60118.1 hypothetical protein SAMN05216278_2154 [Halopelagius longus]
MIWQDLIFLAGSIFSLFVLVPALRDATTNIPLGTSLPSATIGIVYGTTFFSLGMTMSAAGSILTGLMWSIIAILRSPHPFDDVIGSNGHGHGQQATHSAPQNAD